MVAAASYIDPVKGPHPEVIAAVVRFAERQADFAAAAIDALVTEATRRGDTFDGRRLPAGFLLELGAVMQLQVWEDSGVRSLLTVEVPTAAAAAADLNARVQADPGRFTQVDAATLSNQLLRVWLEHFSWSAPEMLGVDIVIGRLDEEELVETMAQLLWKYRRTESGAN